MGRKGIEIRHTLKNDTGCWSGEFHIASFIHTSSKVNRLGSLLNPINTTSRRCKVFNDDGQCIYNIIHYCGPPVLVALFEPNWNKAPKISPYTEGIS